MARKRILAKLLMFLIAMTFIVGASCATRRPAPQTRPLAAPAISAAELFEDGMNAFRRGDMNAATDKLEAYLTRAPEGDHAPEALLTLGKVALYERRYDDAEARFAELARGYPGTSFDAEARHLAKVTNAERDKARSEDRVYQLTEQREKAETPQEKREIDEKLVDVALAVGEPYDAFKEALRLQEDSRSKGRAFAEYKMLEVVDAMNRVELEKAFKDDVEPGSYAAGLVTLRLGALALHTGDLDRAERYLGAFMRDYADHPQAARAERLKLVLDGRRKVEPTAIGVLLPDSYHYQRIKNAVELAEQQIKKEFPSIRFIYRDTKADPTVALEAFEALVVREHVIAVIGPLMSDTSEAVAALAQSMGVPMITLSPSPGLPASGSYIFRSAMTARHQAQAVVSYTWDVLHKRSFGILYPMHPYGVEMAQAFWDEVKMRGGWITGVQRYEHDETTFREHVRELVGRYILTYGEHRSERCDDPLGLSCGVVRTKQEEETMPRVDFDALFIPDYAKQAGMIAPTIPFEEVEIDTGLASTYRRVARKERRLGHPVKMIQLIGGNGWNNPRLVTIGGKWVEGAIFCDGFFPDATTQPVGALFAEQYNNAYKRMPTAIEAYAYDAAGLAATAITSRSPKSREDMRRALHAIREFEGATGKMHFDENGEMVNPLVVLTLQEGEIVPADAAKKSERPGVTTEEEIEQAADTPVN